MARGVCRVGSDGYLEQVVELTAIAREGDHAKDTSSDGKVTMLTGDEPVSMNMFGFTPQVFGRLDEHFQEVSRGQRRGSQEGVLHSQHGERDASWPVRRKVKVLRSNDSWFGVTYREDHAHVVESIQQLVKSGKYPERLWA